MDVVTGHVLRPFDSGRPRMPEGREDQDDGKDGEGGDVLVDREIGRPHADEADQQPAEHRAPGSEPMPPRTAAVKAFAPGTKPSENETTP